MSRTLEATEMKQVRMPENSGNNRMNTKQQNHDTKTRVEMKLEVEIIPVSDVERSKRFYQRLGWRFDDDVSPVDGVRIVQFTPPGSACSVTFGKGITAAAPGSAESALVVSDIEAAHDEPHEVVTVEDEPRPGDLRARISLRQRPRNRRHHVLLLRPHFQPACSTHVVRCDRLEPQ